MTSLCIIINKEHGEDWSCAASSEAQKYKIVQNCVRINGRRVPVVSAAETAIYFQPWPANSLNGNASAESEPAQPKSKSKVKLNFGLSPDFSFQLKVLLSESLSERLNQKLK